VALPLDQLVQPLTKEQARASILALCGALGLNTTAWQSGGVTRTIIAVVAQLFASFTEGVAYITRAGFLDLAEGGFLTLLAYFGFGVTRIAATFASGNLTVTNASGGLYKFKVGQFVVSNSVTKQTFVNAEAFELQPVGVTGNEATVAFRAQAAGAAGTSSPGDISQLVTSTIGVTVTNPTSFVGIDAELDPALRQRCRDKLGSLSPDGPKRAYAFIAKSALDANGAPIGVNRVQVLPADGTGVVTIYLATTTGAVTGPNVTIIDDEIQQLVVPDAVTANVSSATNVVVPVNADFWIYTSSGLTTGEAQALVQQALNNYFPTIPIGGLSLDGATGGVLFRALEAVITGVSEHSIEARINPEVDVLLDAGEVAVPGVYTITVHLVTGGV
jgi:phage-related baseplate assembly protein